MCFVAGLALLAAVPAARAENLPAARFRGAPTYDLLVTNVHWEAGTEEYSFVTFDLSWGHSWRAKWVEPAATSVTGKDLEVESWDAAWVFVKFLPDKENRNSIERNHWQHAALDPDPRQHVMPAGATNSVRLFDGGSQGMGVFIYRDALGYGPNNFKGIKLRWRHGAVAGQKIDPAKAGLRVYPISMVYIPEGPFKVGSGADSGFTKFPDGPTVPIANGDYMGAMNVGLGSRTDGSWRGGPVVPFLVDAEWNGPVVEGTRGRRVGSKAGQLWSVLTFAEYWVDRPSVGSTGFLNDDYPTGYEAFYGMKYDITQGQYVDFVNSLPPDVAAGRAFLSDEIGCDYPLGEGDVKIKLDLGPEYKPYFYNERAGLTITVSTRTEECRGKGVLKPKELEVGQVSTEPTASGDLLDNALGETDRQAEAAKQKKLVKVPPVYAARLPFRACSGISRHDLYAYAVWAGLRPMTELESGKAGQGPRNPGACENNTVTNHGTAADNWAAAAASLKDLVDVGLPTERFARGNHAGGYGSPLTVFRVGCFATPTSDQVAAGASYWGLLELGAGPRVISLLNRDYQGTHGDGTTPAGKPGGSTGRGMAPFDAPPDWPTRTWEYYSGRWVWNRGRLVISAGNRTKKTAPQPAPAMAKPSPASGAPSAAAATAGRVADALTIANLKWAPGTKDYSTISFDLAWNNSWRTTWTEPADKNVTGKPLRLANWDAAWVFIKFRPTVTNALLHATVSPEAEDHRVPTDAKLDVGLSDDGSKGVGVFIYRSADGSGANNFKNIKLRWLHGAGQVPDQATFKDSQLRAYAIGMVYVPGGQFQSRVPWEQTVTTIRLGDATKQGGCRVLTNTPVYAECPNGYNAFYSTKYAISQGQYADYLNAQGPARGGPGLYGVSRYMIRCDTNAGVYVAEVPDRGCNFLGWPQILNYEAWAGLRPLTDLEYEKACRGPRAVARAEDAWAAGICAPAAGLSKELFPGLPDIDAGASYWGIRGLSLSGCVHEWPGIIFENERGKGFKGTHGEGQPVLPKDWPGTCSLHVRDAPFPAGAVATWVSPDDIDRVVTLGENLVFMYTGRYGARAVRTAPSVADASSPLQLDRLADLRAVDLALLPLAGSFRNDGDQPLQVELDTPLPEAAFLDGAASRRFTAAPRAVAPFKIRLLLTREAFLRAAQGGQTMPVRVRLCGSGDVLAEQAFDPRFQVNPVPEQLPVIGPLTDGEVPLRLTNLTERPLPLTVTLLPPADFVISGAAEQRVELAANAAGRVAFSAPRQTPTNEGVCRIPYRVVAAGGTALEGAAVVQQRLASRWWISRKVHTGPAGGGDGMDALDNAPGMADLTNYDSAIFKAATPPKNWASATYGASLAFGSAGNLPSQGSTIQAATRVVPPAERQALLDVPYGGKGAVQLEIIVWVNDTIVFKLDANRKTEAKPFLLRKSGNTLLVECRSADNAAGSLGYMGLSFRDAKSGAPLYGLVFDIEKP
jgi:formylglycine-generating enzyme required for sulfatase activity